MMLRPGTMRHRARRNCPRAIARRRKKQLPDAMPFGAFNRLVRTSNRLQAPHGPERRVAFNAVRLPIRRIVVQYGEVARAAFCASSGTARSLRGTGLWRCNCEVMAATSRTCSVMALSACRAPRNLRVPSTNSKALANKRMPPEIYTRAKLTLCNRPGQKLG